MTREDLLHLVQIDRIGNDDFGAGYGRLSHRDQLG